MNMHSMFVVFLFFQVTESIYVDSKQIDVENVADYTDLILLQRKATDSLRDIFLEKKKQKDIIRNFDRLVSNNTIYIDGISHYEVTASSERVKNIENDFKILISMQYMKYENLRDAHWRTWREVKDPTGHKKIISYKCQSLVQENCTGCEGKGVWLIEEGTPPCPYEIFSLKNSNEMCVVKYTEINKNLFDDCPRVIKYTELTKTCNNPIITRWRFTRNYRISGRYSSVICNGRDFCKVLTLYQIYPQYVVFRIVSSGKIIYSRVMRNDQKIFACVTDCGNMNMNTYQITHSKEKLFNLLTKLAKRHNQNKTSKYKENIYWKSQVTTSTGTKLSNIKSTTSKIKKKVPMKKRVPSRKKTRAKSKPDLNWIRTDTGYYLRRGFPLGTTERQGRRTNNEHSTFYDSLQDIREKFHAFYEF